MIKISAVILAGNREDIIEGCLKTIGWVEEKILVAVDSYDKTTSIAKRYNCQIIKGSQEYNFSRWRDQGAETAKGEWLLYIDTDERVNKDLQREILSTVNNLQSAISAYYIPRKNYFWGKEFKTTYPDYQLRLIKKTALISWQNKIHETPKIKGKIGKLTNPLIHFSHRSLESAITNTLNWSKLEADYRFKNNHPKMNSWRFMRILLTGFYDQFFNKKMWREGAEGIIEGLYQIFSLFFTYIRLWERQRDRSLDKTYEGLDQEIN